MKKTVLFFLLAMLTAVMAGCGKETPEDQFAFGNARVFCADSVITLRLPFELAIQGKPSDEVPSDPDSVTAGGSNSYMQVIAAGRKTDTDIDTAAAASMQSMKDNGAVSGLQSQKSEGQIGDERAAVLRFQFTETDRGKAADLSVVEYIFREGDVLWRVIYQYRTQDETGKALAGYTAGRIVSGYQM